jgi:DNA-binding IclR family transcriptional regulator
MTQESVRAAGRTLGAAERRRFLEDLPTIRSQGMELRQDTPMPGLSAMSAPVFGLSGEMAFALTLFDETGAMALGFDGQTAQELRRRADELSMRLGHYGA